MSFFEGGKWPPKTKFCTTSSLSKQPPTRADCAPLVEHASSNTAELDQVYQLGNYLTTWCAHDEIAIDDLGFQADMVLAHMKLLHDEKQAEKAEKEPRRKKKEERRAREEKRKQQTPRYSPEMSDPYWWREVEEGDEEEYR